MRDGEITCGDRRRVCAALVGSGGFAACGDEGVFVGRSVCVVQRKEVTDPWRTCVLSRALSSPPLSSPPRQCQDVPSARANSV